MPGRRLIAGVIPALLATASVALAGSTEAYAGPTATAAAAADLPNVYTDPIFRAEWAQDTGCTLLEPVRARYVWANGNTVPPAAPPEVKQLATLELTYEMPGGTTVTTVREPHIVGPPKVPLALLRSFGYDARQAAYRNYANTAPEIMCVGQKPISSLAWKAPRA